MKRRQSVRDHRAKVAQWAKCESAFSLVEVIVVIAIIRWLVSRDGQEEVSLEAADAG